MTTSLGYAHHTEMGVVRPPWYWRSVAISSRFHLLLALKKLSNRSLTTISSGANVDVFLRIALWNENVWLLYFRISLSDFYSAPANRRLCGKPFDFQPHSPLNDTYPRNTIRQHTNAQSTWLGNHFILWHTAHSATPHSAHLRPWFGARGCRGLASVTAVRELCGV